MPEPPAAAAARTAPLAESSGAHRAAPVVAAAVPLGRSRAARPLSETLRRRAIAQHAAVAGLCLGVLIVAWCGEVVGQSRVRLWPLGWVVPGVCTFRELFHLPCPGCGLTRSFVELAHGRLTSACRFNPAGPLLFGLCAVQIPLRGWQIWRIRHRRRELDTRLFSVWVLAAGGVALVQWVWRVWL